MFCISEHIQEAYNTLKVKGSLFHQSAARQFLVTTITNKYSAQANMPEPHVYLETLAKTLVDDLMKCLLECTANGGMFGNHYKSYVIQVQAYR